MPHLAAHCIFLFKVCVLIVFCFPLQATEPPPPRETGLPDLEQIFTHMDERAFRQILSDKIRVDTDLRPLLQDYGKLTRRQSLLAFRKLRQRFNVLECEITNSQSDTNYSWLEIYVNLLLEDQPGRRIYRITFALQFKIASSRIVLERWVLQDIR